jgi:predicted MFS family arabinose efflux permease
MAVIAVLLIPSATLPIGIAPLLVARGFFGTAAPVGWGLWLSRVLHDDAEAGGGLQVAVIQFAIMLGAAGGGLVFDGAGWASTFGLAAALLLGSSTAAALAWFEREHAT